MNMTDTSQGGGTGPSACVPIMPSRAARRWALFLLMLTMMMSFLDRQIVNILAEDIKRDLGLADWHIGILTGLAFAVIYTSLSVPVAWLTSRVNRPVMIASAVSFWSLCTFMSGFAQNFVSLCIARAGVGAGEAGGVPPGHSLISDMTPRDERASALAFFHLGIPLGTLAGLALGGLLVDHMGWRGAFMVAGVPGLLIALLLLLTLRETRTPQAQPEPIGQGPSFNDVLRYLKSKHSFWRVALGGSLKSFVGYAHIPFTAAFFFRVHDAELSALGHSLGLQSAGVLGLAMGLISGIGGTLGMWLGGRMTDALGQANPRAYAVIPAAATLCALPFMLGAYWASSAWAALLCLVPPAILNMFYMGPMHFTGQSVVPPSMRANSSAILLIILNVIGLGLGPLMVGLLSDGLSIGLGLGPAEGVRWALLLSTLVGIPAAWLFWSARTTISRDLVS